MLGVISFPELVGLVREADHQPADAGLVMHIWMKIK